MSGKRRKTVIFAVLLTAAMLSSGCVGKNNTKDENTDAASAYSTENAAGENLYGTETAVQNEQTLSLSDGVYTARFDTDNSMFRVNEAYDGRGILTVEDGKMTIHVSLGSKNIVNLYSGMAEEAKKEGANLLYPTSDTVTYSDGWVDEVYGFDIPVPVLDEEFDVALIGTKGKWYDHKVIVSDVRLQQTMPKDGSYTVELTFEGGSGKAEVLPEADLVVKEGKATAVISWSSPNYDYMIVDGQKYMPVNTEGNSVFEIPVEAFDVPFTVIGDTVAMSTPHEIEYTLTFHSDTLRTAE